VFPLNWQLELPQPAIFNRAAPKQIVRSDAISNEDHFDAFWPQGSSQWDALAHIRHPQHGYYNGTADGAVPGHGGVSLGIHNWARRGIVGRFVLADVAAYLAAQGRPLNPGQRVEVPAATVQACLDSQGVALRGGDILLLHFGWTAWYEALDQAAREAFVLPDGTFVSAGLAAGWETAAWLWDNRVAALAADNPTVEPMPFRFDPPESWLHFIAIPLLGLPLGELFDLRALAAWCAANEVHEGLFTAAPLNALGGIGSTANALALV
jgi:hypothetical protein